MPPASFPAAAAMTPGPRTDSRTSQRGRRRDAEDGSRGGEGKAGAGDAEGSVVPALGCRPGGDWLMRNNRKSKRVTMTVHGFQDAKKEHNKKNSANEKAEKREKKHGRGLVTRRKHQSAHRRCNWFGPDTFS